MTDPIESRMAAIALAKLAPMPERADTRQAREQEYHDQAYGSGAYHAKPTNRFYSVTGSAYGYYADRIRDLANPGMRALEYGCGDGSAAFMLAREGVKVTGIDISEVAIENAIREARDEGLDGLVEFKAMDAESLDLADSSFDLICGTGILHHTDLTRSYPELARTLTHDGRALFIEPLGHNPVINLYRSRTPQYRTEDEHPLVIGDLELANAYFGSVRTRFFTLTSLLAYPARRLPGFSSIVGALERLDQTLFRRSEFATRNAWLVCIDLAEPKNADREANGPAGGGNASAAKDSDVGGE